MPVFKGLQIKMTITYTLILIGVLATTNLSIYYFMNTYNQYQLSNEIDLMLAGINASEWLYENEAAESVDTVEASESVDAVEASESVDTVEASENHVEVALPTVETVLIPKTIDAFSHYLIYDDKQVLMLQKSEPAIYLQPLIASSQPLEESAKPTVVKLAMPEQPYFVMAKMPIVIEGRRIGSYVVARDVTMAYETLENVTLILWLSLLAGAAASIVLGYWLAGKSLKPVQEAYQSKKDFLANASHELKTPLSVLVLSTEALESELSDEKEKTFKHEIVSGMKQELFKMSDLVSRLLFLSRQDSGVVRMTYVTVNLSQLVTGEVHRLNGLFEQKRIRLTAHIEPNIQCRGHLDQLASVVTVLLENAVQYTAAGGQVDVLLEARHNGSEKRIQLSVKDNGIGIAASHLDKIFERFYRVDVSRSKASGGTGLGLSMAKTIVEHHGGTIAVESLEGQGSVFTVVLAHKLYNAKNPEDPL